jgi:hypothetical protein
MVNHHKEQLPLTAAIVSAVGLQTAFVNATVTTSIYIDAVRYVHVAGTSKELRSYWQGQASDAN